MFNTKSDCRRIVAPRLALLIACLGLLSVPGLAQDTTRMNQLVESYVTSQSFMGTVLVARGDQVIFDRAYGSANLEWDVPNTPDTKFRIASITKQFTAAAILLLEERGKLRVTDQVSRYVPDSPPTWDRVTLAHLLSHTSGIPDYVGFPDFPKLNPLPTTAAGLIARFRDRPLDFAPGSAWRYSNSGYVVLTRVIEQVSGRSYEDFVADNIFAPLGMTNSGYDSHERVIARRASGYVRVNERFENAAFLDMSVPQGAGALYSTTRDLLRWQNSLHGGKLLSATSLKKMTTPNRNGYAFGVGIDSISGRPAISHNGGINGFATELQYYPGDRLTIVVLSNVNGGAMLSIAAGLSALAHGQRVTLLDERIAVPLDSSVLRRYVGAYRTADGTNRIVILQGDQLAVQRSGRLPWVLGAISPARFFVTGLEPEVEFSGRDQSGRATHLTEYQYGRALVATRIGDAEAEPLIAAALAVSHHVAAQVPTPGAKAVLRRLLDELRAGSPDYSRIADNLAVVIRAQLSRLQSDLQHLGVLQSLTFKGVEPAGADIYEARFARGALEWRLRLTADGRLATIGMRRLP